MMKDTPQGQTNHCPTMSQFANQLDCLKARDKWHVEKIAELERKLAQYQSIFPDSDGHFELKAIIAQARAEQREEDAKICDAMEEKETYGKTETYCGEVTDAGINYAQCAEAIRNQK